VFVGGGSGAPSSSTGDNVGLTSGMIGQLVNLLVAEKSGFSLSDNADTNGLKDFADRMANNAMASMEQAVEVPAVKPPTQSAKR